MNSNTHPQGWEAIEGGGSTQYTSLLTLEIIENWDAFAMGPKELAAKRTELQQFIDEMEALAPEDRNGEGLQFAQNLMDDIIFNIAEWNYDPYNGADHGPGFALDFDEEAERTALYIDQFHAGVMPAEGTPERDFFNDFFAIPF